MALMNTLMAGQLDAANKRYAGNNPDMEAMLKGLTNMTAANTSLLMGNPEESLKSSRAALASYILSAGESHPDVGSIRLNMGIALEMLERYGEAIEELLKAEAIFVANFEEDTLDLATIRERLASCYYIEDETDKALPLAEYALEVMDRILGPADDRTLKALEMTALICDELERYETARDRYLRLEALIGDKPEYVAMRRNAVLSLVLIFEALGDEERTRLYEDRAEIYRAEADADSDGDEEEVDDRSAPAEEKQIRMLEDNERKFREEGDFEQAFDNGEKAIALLWEAAEPDSSRLGNLLFFTGRDLMKLERPAEAAEHFETSFSAFVADDHAVDAVYSAYDALNAIAIAGDRTRFEEQCAEMTRTLDAMDGYSVQHRFYLYGGIGTCYERFDASDEQLDWLLKRTELNVEQNAENLSKLVTAHNKIGNILYDRDRDAEASVHYELGIAILRGLDNPGSLVVLLMNCANALSAQELDGEAKLRLEEALRIEIETAGEESERAVRIRERIDELSD